MHTPAFILGCAILLIAWLGPWPGTFSAHMAVHMSVVAAAAPLVALGLSGSRFDPTIPFSPILASVIELIVVWLWHTPALHAAARGSLGVLALEQGSFLLSGLMLWIAALGGPSTTRANRGAEGIVALLRTAMHMTLLGALLALAPRPFYTHHGHGDLADQHLGGVIMLLVGGASYLAGGLWLSWGLLRGHHFRDSRNASSA